MTGPSRRSMANDRSQNCDIIQAADALSDEHTEARSPGPAGDMRDPNVIGVLDDPEFLLRSTAIGDSLQLLHPYAQDFADEHEKRATSWPAVPRGPRFNPLQKRIESFQRRTERLTVERERAHLMRMELKFRRNNYRQQHKWVDESQRNLNDHIELMLKNDDLVTTRDDYLFYYGRARDDYFRLEELSSLVQTLENELTTLEETIERLELQLKATSERILSLLRHQDPTIRDEGDLRDANNTLGAPTEQFSSDAGEDGAGSTSSRGNPLLEDYFDKAGNVQVGKDRLLELFKEHQEKRALRIHQQDQGEELAVADAVFDIECKLEVKAARQVIHDAIILKQKAKQECRNTGIDPDKFRHASDQPDDDDEEGDDHVEPKQSPAIRLHLGHGEKTGPYTILTTTGPFGEAVVVDEDQPDLPPVSDTVERWIESMDPAQIDPLLEQMTSQEMTAQNESPSRVALLTQELEPYFTKREDAETIAQLVVKSMEFAQWTKTDVEQVAGSTGSSTLLNHSRSSSESRLTSVKKKNKPTSHIDFLRKELQQYLLKHGSADVITRLSNLGIELPATTKEDINHMATYARSAMSDRSRSSSESRLGAMLRTDLSRSELVARLGFTEIDRGRKR